MSRRSRRSSKRASRSSKRASRLSNFLRNDFRDGELDDDERRLGFDDDVDVERRDLRDGSKEEGLVEAGVASVVEEFLSVVAGPPSDVTEGVGREDGL